MSGRWRLLIGCAAAVCAVLTGACHRAVRAPAFDAMPVPVVIPRLQFIPVPGELTGPLPIAMPQNLTCGEAVRVARERRAALERANADRAQVRALTEASP